MLPDQIARGTIAGYPLGRPRQTFTCADAGYSASWVDSWGPAFASSSSVVVACSSSHLQFADPVQPTAAAADARRHVGARQSDGVGNHKAATGGFGSL
jgi:hypothetical protein